MKIVVCIKQVVAADRVRIDPHSHTLIRDAKASYVNPHDLYALEAALMLKERYFGQITAVTMGPPASEDVLRQAIAMGADRGVLFTDPAFAGADTLATSYVLGKGILGLDGFDLILCGTETADSGTAQVGPQLAEELNLPAVCGVERIELQGDVFRVERVSDGFREELDVSPPALFTISREAVLMVRLPSLIDIQAAFDAKEVLSLGLKELEADPEKIGKAGSGTWVTELTPVPRQKSCEFIEGDVRQQVEILMQKLIERNLIGQ